MAPATVASYRMCLRLYVLPQLGGKRLDKLTVRDVQTWLNRLRSACQCCAQGKDAEREEPLCCAAGRCCRQVLADWTVHQAYAVLRAALSQAAREELVTRNVAALVRVSVPRTVRRNLRPSAFRSTRGSTSFPRQSPKAAEFHQLVHLLEPSKQRSDKVL